MAVVIRAPPRRDTHSLSLTFDGVSITSAPHRSYGASLISILAFYIVNFANRDLIYAVDFNALCVRDRDRDRETYAAVKIAAAERITKTLASDIISLFGFASFRTLISLSLSA